MEYIKLLGYERYNNILKIYWEESEGLKKLVFKDTILINNYLTDYEINDSIVQTMFLALIVPCYANIDDIIVLKSFSKINRNMYNKFSQYHQYNNIKLDTEHSYAEVPSNYKFTDIVPSCFYGGGKDSLLATAMMGELFGAKNVSLLRMSWSPHVSQLETKTNLLMPIRQAMKDRKYAFYMLESNFHTIVKDITIGRMAHLGLYVSVMLPIMKYRKINFAAYGFDATEFHMTDNNTVLPYRRSRPEIVSILNDALSIGMGYNIKLFNFNYAIPPTTAFKILVNRYPEYMNNIYMCERSGGKWCIRCRKCFTYALYSLSYRYENMDFGLSYFFQNSTYVKSLVNKIKANNNQYNKYTYELLSYKKHISSTLDAISEIDLEYAKKRIFHTKYPDAYDNFLTIISPLMGYKHPEFSSFWLQAHLEQEEKIGINLKDSILKIIKSANINICESNIIEGKMNRGSSLSNIVYKYNLKN